MIEFAWTASYGWNPVSDQIRHDHREYPERFRPDDRGDGPTLWVLEYLNLKRRPMMEIGSISRLAEPVSSPVVEDDGLQVLSSRLRKSIRWSFTAGVVLVAATLAGFWFGGIWVGLAFIPGVIAAYGLFLSSGSQLEKLEGLR